MLPFSRRLHRHAEPLSESDLVEVAKAEVSGPSNRVSSSGVVAKMACDQATKSIPPPLPAAAKAAPAPPASPAESVDVIFDEDSSPKLAFPPVRAAVPTPLSSSLGILVEVAELVKSLEPSAPFAEPPTMRASSSLPSFPVDPGSSPRAIDAVLEEPPRPPVPSYGDDEPTRPLGTLPPPPFPRHLAGGDDPPTVRLSESEIPGPPPPMSSLAPVASDTSSELSAARRAPTMRVRPLDLDSQELLLIRGRPSFGWAATLLVLGAAAGIGSWEGVQAVRDVAATESAPPAMASPVLAQPSPAPAPAAPPVAKVEEKVAEAKPAEKPAEKPVEKAAPKVEAKSEAKQELAKAAPKSDAPKTDAPKVDTSKSEAKAAPRAVAVVPAAAPPKKPVPPAVAEAPAKPREPLSDAQADALARAQLKAALR